MGPSDDPSHHELPLLPPSCIWLPPVVEHWLEREIAQWVHSMKDRSDDPSHQELPLLPRSYISLPPVIEHWLEREIAQWVHSMKDRSDDPSHHELHIATSHSHQTRQQLPGQIRSHCSVATLSDFPSHGLPPRRGCGLLHVRLLITFWFPWPQETLHVPITVLVQMLHPPCTAM